MKTKFHALVLLCLFGTAYAQSPKPLQVGDTVPDITLRHLINAPQDSLSLASFRGQWLILDFWATWCSPCIAQFPKTDSLQTLFRGQVQFLAITYESAAQVNALFSKLQKLKGLQPLMVTEDTLLQALFPHSYLPHYVWINPAGVVKAITGHQEVNAETLHQLMANEVPASRKQDKATIPFSRFEHLVNLPEKLQEAEPYFAATLTAYIPSLKGFTYTPPGQVLAINAPRRTLYSLAYGEARRYFGPNRIFLEVADRSAFIEKRSGQPYLEWMARGNAFCYEVRVPAHKAGQEYAIMQEDLKRFFPEYTASVELRTIPCLVLIRTSKKDKLRSKGNKETQVDIRPYEARLQNAWLNTLVGHLEVKYLQHLPTPLINQTGYTERVDLHLMASLSQVEELRKALQAYDLDLVERMEEIEVLVIRDTTSSQ